MSKPTHPDQARWDPKHRRWVEQDSTPEPHNWLNDPLDSVTIGPVIDLASGISAVPRQVSHKKLSYYASDISPVALRQTRELMCSENLEGGVCQADLEHSVPFQPLDGVYLLTFFYSPFLFRWVADCAAPGSLIFAETYCAKGEDTPISEDYCLKPGELKSYYEDWTIDYYEECHTDHPETARLIASK